MNENVDKVQEYLDFGVNLAIEYAPKLLLAIVVLLIGFRLISWAVKATGRTLEKSKMDATLLPFIKSLLSWGLKIMLLIAVAGMVGIETMSFVAVLGAVGLAIGMALQGTLSNFAGGILILVLKPYKIGDLVKTQGHIGVVKEIQIFNTILLDAQSRTIILPNGAVANGDITNFTREGKLRCDMVFGIDYNSDIKLAKDVLMKILKEDKRVLETPAPFIGVLELGDSSVNLTVRPWVKTADNWGVYFDTMEKGKVALEAAGISIPYPQMDVHLDK